MPLINMFVLHTHKDNALSLETVGFYGIDPEASLEEFFRLNFKRLINFLNVNRLNYQPVPRLESHSPFPEKKR